jgi:hypothetical protein
MDYNALYNLYENHYNGLHTSGVDVCKMCLRPFDAIYEPATCVSSVYYVGFDDILTLAEYKTHVLNTLARVQTPFVLFLDPVLNWSEDILKARAGRPIQIVKAPVDKIAMWSYISRTTDIVYDSDVTYKNLMPEQLLLQYNKLVWIDTVAKINPYGSSQFVWIDADYSRFIETGKYEFDKTFSGHTLFNIATVGGWENLLVELNKFIGANDNVIDCRMFVTNTNSLMLIKDVVDAIWYDDMIRKRRIVNFGVALALAYKGVPEVFNLKDIGFNDTFKSL